MNAIDKLKALEAAATPGLQSSFDLMLAARNALPALLACAECLDMLVTFADSGEMLSAEEQTVLEQKTRAALAGLEKAVGDE